MYIKVHRRQMFRYHNFFIFFFAIAFLFASSKIGSVVHSYVQITVCNSFNCVNRMELQTWKKHNRRLMINSHNMIEITVYIFGSLYCVQFFNRFRHFFFLLAFRRISFLLFSFLSYCHGHALVQRKINKQTNDQD